MLIRSIRPFWVGSHPITIGRVLDVSPEAADNQSAFGDTFHIDARGTDPVLTQANVYRAMQAARTAGARDAVHAMSEKQRRTAQ